MAAWEDTWKSQLKKNHWRYSLLLVLSGLAHAGTVPSQAEIDAAFGRWIACDFDASSPDTRQNDERVFNYLEELWQAKSEANGHSNRRKVRFTVKGVVFTQTDGYAGVGGVFQLAYAPSATPAQLAELMGGYGWTFVSAQAKEFNVPGLALQAMRMDMKNTTKVLILPGGFSIVPNQSDSPLPGSTLACTFTSTSAADWRNKDGLPTYDQMLVADQKNEAYPREWIEPIVAKGIPEARAAIISRSELTDDQVDRLWQDPRLRLNLISAKFDQLKPGHLEELIVKRDSVSLERLIAQWLPQLPDAYVARLKTMPPYDRMIAIALGKSDALDDLRRALKAQNDAEVRRFMALHKNYDDAVMEAIFTHGTDRWKQEAIDRRQSEFTPAQIERALTDPSVDVQIWLLRRKDVRISRAQYDRGINHPDEKVAFWYRLAAHVPSSEQVDAGLASPDEPTRWSWATRQDIVLTAKQIEKVRQDPESRRVRYSIWPRPEWTPTEADLDKCFAEMDGYAMGTCISRNDFDIRPQWFEAILRNPNRNVFRAWLKHPRFSQATYEQMLHELALRADDQLLQGLMNDNQLLFSDEHTQIFPVGVTLGVKRAYCRRIGANCPL